MKTFVGLIFTLLLSTGLYHPVFASSGKITGGQTFHMPDWFKVSFLEIYNDAKEAKEAGKHLLIFMHLENCPYCSRMLKENFTKGDNKNFVENFIKDRVRKYPKEKYADRMYFGSELFQHTIHMIHRENAEQ